MEYQDNDVLYLLEEDICQDDRQLAVFALGNRIMDARTDAENGDIDAQQRTAELCHQLVSIDMGDARLSHMIANRAREENRELDLQEDLAARNAPEADCDPSAEQLACFEEVYDRLNLLGGMIGNKVVATESRTSGYTFGTTSRMVSNDAGNPFVPNAASMVADVLSDGVLRHINAVVLEPGLSSAGGIVASIDIWDGENSCPATIYRLYTDGNIKVTRRTQRDDSEYTDGSPRATGIDEASLNWLTPSGIKTLLQTIDTIQLA